MGDSMNIQISSNLVDQLVPGEKKPKRKTQKPSRKPSHERQQHVGRGKFTPSAPATGWPLHTPVYLPPPPVPPAIAELEAITSVLRESEQRLEQLKKQEDVMTEELTKRAKELHDQEFKLPDPKPVPCLSERNACLQCYEEHLNDPLKCRDLVKKFSYCASEARKQAASVK